MLQPDEQAVPHTHLSKLPADVWDLIVIGAGPSGSVCATGVARAGFKVLLIDKEPFPRDKSCGDLLIADSFASLRRMQLFDAVRSQAHIVPITRVYSPSKVTFDIPGEYLGIKRRALDAILVREAVEAGAILAHAHVQQVSPDGDSQIVVEASAADPPVRGRIAVLATGSVNDLAQKAGIAKPVKPSAVAIRTYIESDSGSDVVVLSYDREMLPGYGWIIPVGEKTYNVGCGITYAKTEGGHHHLKRQLDRFLTTFPPAMELMRQGKQVAHVTGSSIRCALDGVNTFSRGRILGIGETVGTTFPFTGEGIGKAMETAEIAIEVIIESLRSGGVDPLAKYGDRILKTLAPRYDGYIMAEKWLGKAWLNDFVARRVSRSRYLRRAVTEFMAELGDPRKIYSLSSIIRSYFQ
ncbi:MAG TPA: NAD(P)/FAD-dependent oxidoreductase [candidate division Zixibacteria bacterium]|nr:NAD(P)/FAD-dependent oxidoreductase [candidate division Zixibacteria bacterium]